MARKKEQRKNNITTEGTEDTEKKLMKSVTYEGELSHFFSVSSVFSVVKKFSQELKNGEANSASAWVEAPGMGEITTRPRRPRHKNF